MKSRVAVINIIVENQQSVNEMNALLHEYGSLPLTEWRVIGRMGIPYYEKNINIICLAVDASQDRINALTGSLGRLDGITAKAAYSKLSMDVSI